MTKIIKLNIEEKQLKKEIRDSGMKVEKNNTNNISVTHNEILQELNNLLKNDESTINKIYTPLNMTKDYKDNDSDHIVEHKNYYRHCHFI